MQGLNVAAAAAAAGNEVTVWLAGEAAWLGTDNPAYDCSVQYSAPASELLAEILQTGQAFVCAQCAKRREIEDAHLRPGVSIAGAAAFVAQVSQPDVQALVF